MGLGDSDLLVLARAGLEEDKGGLPVTGSSVVEDMPLDGVLLGLVVVAGDTTELDMIGEEIKAGEVGDEREVDREGSVCFTTELSVNAVGPLAI